MTARLSARGLVRRFPGVLALGGVDLDARPGEVVALVGENGAGKSTLLKCLAGLEQPDEGSMTYEGGVWAPRSTAEAASGGVALVHQELCLAENLSAAENIGLGREPRRGWLPLVDRQALRERAAHALERVGATFGPDVKVERLAAGQRQLVEIAKGIDQDARVLILDEPTSSLTSKETSRLFELVHQLRANGITVLYVSHRLTEILELADRAFVLRDGQNAGHLTRDQLTREAMVRLMVGRDLAAPVARAEAGGVSGAPVLELRELVTDAFPAAAVDLQVRPGELVGLAGLVGAGRTELLETVFGLRAPVSGEVRVDGQPERFRGPRDAARAGLALVPEDRKLQGLLLEEGVRVNTALATLDRRRRRGLVDGAAERAVAAAQVERLGVRTAGIEQVVQTLSGGNQQKVVVGRWLAAEPTILLMDEPTRGVDVGAREELYLLLERLASEGLAVLFASSDMEELLRLSDRVVVLHDGQITGTLDRSVATEEAVMELATGGGSRIEGATT
ncbi:sugar ABC transporter ATP-binding protein [bacterium]|nr:sugar ABC transporter ATP-binding protein [bacterium]